MSKAIYDSIIFDQNQIDSIMKVLTFLFFSLLFFGANNSGPIPIKLDENGTAVIKGNLDQGKFINDLSWAWSSSNACFPATQKEKFTGHHVFYTTDLPRYSEMQVKVIPDDSKQNFSIYAYEVGLQNNALVPDLPSCIRCEADHKWDRPFRGRTQDHTRVVKDLVAINNPYKVVVGVVGANGLAKGCFTLEFKRTAR